MLAKIQPDTNIKVLSGPFAACRDSKKNLQKELYMDSITYANFRTIVAILKGEKVQKNWSRKNKIPRRERAKFSRK